MKRSLSSQLEPITKPLAKFLWRFHVIFYSLVVMGGVAIVLFLFTGLLTASPDTPQPMATSFDKQTIKAIKNFEPSSSTRDSFSLPAGRANPFAE